MNDKHHEVLLSAAEGDSARETAEGMECSVAWVCRLRCELCKELGARNIVNAVSIAYQRGILLTRHR